MAQIELTAAQTADLRGAQTAVDTLRDQLTRAERAGLDVAELRARFESAEAKRLGLLANFTPGTTGPRRSR